MTRLKTNDIKNIPSSLTDYDYRLQAATGKNLLGIAAHTWGVFEKDLKHTINAFCIHVIPVTAGQGVINDFSETVCAILKFLGFQAKVSVFSDVSGLASAYENKADAVMLADDRRFVGINLHTCAVADNSEVTGRVFASALDLMTGGIRERSVLVIGCGPVGAAGAEWLLRLGAGVALYDIRPGAAAMLREKLINNRNTGHVHVLDDINMKFNRFSCIFEATPADNTIPDEWVSDQLIVTAPGVPLGVSDKGRIKLENRLIHDKLELGVAAMAVSLVLNLNLGDLTSL